MNIGFLHVNFLKQICKKKILTIDHTFTTRNSLNTNGIANRIILAVIGVVITDRLYSVSNLIGRYRRPKSVGIYRQNYWRNVENLKKNGVSLMWRLLRVFFTDEITKGFKTSTLYCDVTDSPMKMLTESLKDSKRQLRTVMWPIHRCKCRRIRTVRWRALFANKVADEITDPSVYTNEITNWMLRI